MSSYEPTSGRSRVMMLSLIGSPPGWRFRGSGLAALAPQPPRPLVEVRAKRASKPRPSAVELAAVDGEHLAGDGGGEVAGEEERRAGDLLRGGEPLEVGRRRLLGVHLLVGLALHGGEEVEVAAVDVLVDVRRSHAVDPDAARPELGGQRR